MKREGSEGLQEDFEVPIPNGEKHGCTVTVTRKVG